uniref:uncharacterized protein LOC120328555 n=1 Tax=Styela clava TaxID=7725 RepID=UPI00193AC99B|nr:uncharacterized protein LOC120328555 [Styela clava]
MHYTSKPSHTERSNGAGILSRMRQSLGKAWKRTRSEPSMSTNAPNVRPSVSKRMGDNGWLSYFTQRSLRSSNTSIRSGYQHSQSLDRPRKIRRTVITEKINKNEFDCPSTEKEYCSQARQAFSRRSISMPNPDDMVSKRDLRRSVSSKELSGTLGQNGINSNRDFRTQEERIVEQTKDFCRDVIVQKLKRNNLIHRVKIARPACPDQWLLRDIHAMCNELERRNHGLCKNLSKQLGITLRSEEVLRKVFFEISLEIISTYVSAKQTPTKTPSKNNSRGLNSRTDSEENQREKEQEVTWGRIMGILVISGAFSIDCIKQGHSELVDELIEICGDFFQSEGLVDWIMAHGGWEKLSEKSSCGTKDKYDTANAWNIFLVSACVVASLAFGVGFSNLTAAGG